MTKNLWKNIKDNLVWSAVVAALIMLVITKIANALLHLDIVSSMFNFITTKYIFTIWELVLVGSIPCIIMLVVYILYKRVIFIEEEGVYKAIHSERRFCVICNSPLQKIDNYWHCNKCNRDFGKKPLVAASCSSPRVAKSRYVSTLHRW